jgi:hypothetical protein
MELLAFRIDLYLKILVLLVARDGYDNLVDNPIIFCVYNEEISLDSHTLLEVLAVNLSTGSGVQVSDRILRDHGNISVRVN